MRQLKMLGITFLGIFLLSTVKNQVCEASTSSNQVGLRLVDADEKNKQNKPPKVRLPQTNETVEHWCLIGFLLIGGALVWQNEVASASKNQE